jgi:adenylate cyclase
MTKNKGFFKSFFRSHSLRLDILAAVSGLLIITVFVIVSFTYHNNSKTVLSISNDFIDQVSGKLIEKSINYLTPASNIIELTTNFVDKDVLSLKKEEQLTSYAIEILKLYPQLTMLNYGDEKGNFLMQKRLPNGSIATKIVDRNISPATVTWKYRSKSGQILKSKTSTKVKYDPRKRPWYIGAAKEKTNYWTDMYIFFSDQKPGVTAAYPVLNKTGKLAGVFSIDIQLEEISNFLKKLNIGKSGLAFIMNNKNELVAFPDVTKIVKEEAGKLRPVKVEELDIGWIAKSFHVYKEKKQDKFIFKFQGKRYIGAYTPFPKSFGKDWIIAMVVPENDFIGDIKKTNNITFIISVIFLAVAILFAMILARSIAKPIVALTKETQRIKEFKLDGKVSIASSIKEIQLMSEGLSSMKSGLKAFQKYVPAALVRQLIKTGDDARIGGQKKELTIFFSDIANFTTISEKTEPQELMKHLSEYLNELTKIIRHNSGTVDKYIGDAIMAFWGAPMPDDNHILHACKAALLCHKKVQELNKQWEADGKPALYTRFGLHTGDTIVGNLGSSERMNYSVIGDSVNLASRLEGVNKMYGTSIIVSEAIYEKTKEQFHFRPLDIVAVKGKTKGIRIFELLAAKDDEISEAMKELINHFPVGFEAYLKQDWDLAIKIFGQFTNDKVARMYVGRCEEFKVNPPDEGWGGVTHLVTK